jgi:hypothetical protein
MDAQIKMAKFHLLSPKKTRNSKLLRLFFRQNKAKFISFLFTPHLCKGL